MFRIDEEKSERGDLMRLDNFTVDNFRSITSAKIPTADFTVLIGQNNEGKSNLMSALVAAMGLIKSHASGASSKDSDFQDVAEVDVSDTEPGSHYSWRRDFPLHLQKKYSLEIGKLGSSKAAKIAPKYVTQFRLTLELSAVEVQEFRKVIGINLNGKLPISITIGKDNEPEFKVVKPGKGAVGFEKKSKEIAKFIGRLIVINYIPTIRTEDESSDIIQRMISREIAKLENDEDYQNSLELVFSKHEEVLNKLSENLTQAIGQFLPQVKKVEVIARRNSQVRAIRNVPNIMIDDGVRTNIRNKGDGIKSLVALSLFQSVDEKTGAFTLLAIEEPESHLHPGAIHSLRAVLQKISSEKQIVITTHCPSLVNRDSVSSNIIVEKNQAKQAKRISDIRNVLGVVPADNLVNASLALLVEGEDDRIVLDAYFKNYQPEIHEAIGDGRLVVAHIGGASKLPYSASIYENAICSIHVFLDDDKEGNAAAELAREKGLIKDSQYNLCRIPGRTVSEFEDLLPLESYSEVVLLESGIDLANQPEFTRKNGAKVWSDRVAECYKAAGKNWGPNIEAALKLKVAHAAAIKLEEKRVDFHEYLSKPLEVLSAALKNRLKIAAKK
ncbi:ATP-dependent nuclease [Herbaspirillum sp. alder98]|uniref:ATP-dependent nuclease n=1 Tax=Herbaspirillum sp. alder98 TaxID=2913096 RepID=UPI001CD82025|nr:AAA family ATPase [Herbaspirillum sp. alder98]MCA1322888.1 ATP-binding protein [Herbaspirillum sp. alder98]